MLRITVIESAAPSKTLKLEGRIAGTLVDEVRRLCSKLLGSAASASSLGLPPTLILDVSDVSFVDPDGIELMRELCRRNVRVTKSSPFLAELLKEVVPC